MLTQKDQDSAVAAYSAHTGGLRGGRDYAIASANEALGLALGDDVVGYYLQTAYLLNLALQGLTVAEYV